jgi:Mg-chelatase subunit ChlD
MSCRRYPDENTVVLYPVPSHVDVGAVHSAALAAMGAAAPAIASCSGHVHGKAFINFESPEDALRAIRLLNNGQKMFGHVVSASIKSFAPVKHAAVAAAPAPSPRRPASGDPRSKTSLRPISSSSASASAAAAVDDVTSLMERLGLPSEHAAPRQSVREEVRTKVTSVRRNNHIHIYLDVSGSMGGADGGTERRISVAIRGIKALLSDMKPPDFIHFYTFSGHTTRILVCRRAAFREDAFFRNLDAIRPSGKTALRDAIVSSISNARDAHARDVEHGHKKAAESGQAFDSARLPLHHIVILTDGEDTSSSASFLDTTNALQHPGMALPSVYFIAVGDAARPSSEVKKIAALGGGHVKVTDAVRAADILSAFEHVRKCVSTYLVREVTTVDLSVTKISGK